MLESADASNLCAQDVAKVLRQYGPKLYVGDVAGAGTGAAGKSGGAGASAAGKSETKEVKKAGRPRDLNTFGESGTYQEPSWYQVSLASSSFDDSVA